MKRRLFISFFISPEIREVLAQTVIALQKELRNERILWVNPSNYHCTIHFLGDVEESLIPHIQSILDDTVREHDSQQFTPKNIEVFSSKSSSGRIVVSLATHNDVVQTLRYELAILLARLGIATPDRSYHPHITLGKGMISAEIPRYIPPLRCVCDTVELLSSVLTTHRSIYTLISSHALRGTTT